MQKILLGILIVFSLNGFGQGGGETCATATSIASIPFVGIGTTSGSNDDLFASCPDVSNTGGAPDEVYTYTTDSSFEYINASLCEAITDYDSQLYIFENNCLSTPVWCQEDGCESPAYSSPYNSRIDAVVLQPNTTYYFVIDGYSSGSHGNYQLDLNTNTALSAPDSSLIPLIAINTYGIPIPDEPKINAIMGIVNNGSGNYNRPTDSYNEYFGNIGIEQRGSSSAMFPKKGYGLETRDSTGSNNNVALFGMPSENDWVLHGPYSDKSLLRNFLAYYMGSQLYNYSPRTQFCELLLNQEYKGVYLFQEKIKRDKGRVDIAKLDNDDIAGDSLTGGYIIKIDKATGVNNDSWVSPYQSNSLFPSDIELFYHYPEPDDIMPSQKTYIESYITAFEDALAGPNYLDSTNGYARFIDANSFVDYLLLTEASRNVDGYRLSTFLYKDRDSKNGALFIGPPWDYNLGFGNVDYCNGERTDGWAFHFNNICPSDDWQIPFWWDRMLTDAAFINRMQCRWQELRSGPFHLDSIWSVIDSVGQLLNEPASRNFNRWEVLGSYVWPNYYVGSDYTDELNYLKNWISDRFIWIDNNLPGAAINCSEILSVYPTESSLKCSLFPNPFTTDFQVTVKGFSTNTKFEIVVMDLLGNDIFRKNYESNSEMIFYSGPIDKLSYLSSGIYLVTVNSSLHSNTIKLVKN